MPYRQLFSSLRPAYDLANGMWNGRRTWSWRLANIGSTSRRRELRRGDELIELEPKVFDLLAFLVQHRDHVVSKDDLLQAMGRAASFRNRH